MVVFMVVFIVWNDEWWNVRCNLWNLIVGLMRNYVSLINSI